jgi:plasmid stability protein
MLHSVSIRTTLTLEDDVAARLRAESRRTGRSLKTVVNEALRVGLDRSRERERASFEVVARDLGLRPEIDLDDIGGLLEQIEGPDHR